MKVSKAQKRRAIRNANKNRPTAGFDSLGEWAQALALVRHNAVLRDMIIRNSPTAVSTEGFNSVGQAALGETIEAGIYHPHHRSFSPAAIHPGWRFG